jgi:hypothetical protein
MQVQVEAPGIGPLLDLSSGAWKTEHKLTSTTVGQHMAPAGKHSVLELPAVAPCSSPGPCLSTPIQMDAGGTLCTAAAGRIVALDSR